MPCPCGDADTVGELSKRRTYAFHSTEYKELTLLRLNSPTVSLLPKAYEQALKLTWTSSVDYHIP